MLVAWEWIKKHAALLLEILIGVAAFLLGVEIKKKPVIIQGTDPEKNQAEDNTAQQEQTDQEAHDTTVAQATSQEQQAQAAVVSQEKTTTTKVVSDVDSTNEYLQGVSKDIGSKS